jgi:hypothetical protein
MIFEVVVVWEVRAASELKSALEWGILVRGWCWRWELVLKVGAGDRVRAYFWIRSGCTNANGYRVGVGYGVGASGV